MVNSVIQPGESLSFLNNEGERTLTIAYAGEAASVITRLRPDGTEAPNSGVYPSAEISVHIYLYPSGNIRQYESTNADGSYVNMLFAEAAPGAEHTFGPDARFTHGAVTFIRTDSPEGAVTEKTFASGFLTAYDFQAGSLHLAGTYDIQSGASHLALNSATHNIVNNTSGTLNGLIGLDGGTLIGNDGSTLIGNDGSTLVGNDGASLIGNDGSTINQFAVNTLIGNDGSTLIGNDGGTLFDLTGKGNSILSSAWALNAGNLIGQDGGSLIGMDGATLAGNLIANFRGYSLLSVDSFSATHGTSGNDVLTGGDGDEVFDTGTGADTVFGHGGDDTANFGDMSKTYPFDSFDGGDGEDTLVMDWSAAVRGITYQAMGYESSPKIGAAESYRILSTTGGGGERIYFKNVERFDITGSNYDDDLRGGVGKDILRGGGGNDTFHAGSGDEIQGGSGNDHVILNLSQVFVFDAAARAAAASDQGLTLADGTKLVSIESISLEAGDGDDVYDLIGTRASGTGPGIFSGNGGNDTFKVDLPNSDTAYFDGGSDNDLLVMDWSTSTTDITYFDNHAAGLQWGYRADMSAGSDTQYVLDYRSVERFDLRGGSGNDDLRGASGDDRINAGLGRDEVDMGAGSDTLVVDWNLVARDAYYGTSSLPYQAGYQGSISFGEFRGVRLTGSLADGYSGAFSFWADDYWNGDTDRVDFKGVEHFHLTLGKGTDHVATGDGNDTIFGNGGSDWYITGKGLDVIDAGGGYDVRWEADKSDAAGMMVDLNQNSFAYMIGNKSATVTGVDSLGSDKDHRFQTGNQTDVIVTESYGQADYIDTNGGSDLVTARGGLDYIDLGTGSDTLVVDYSGFYYDSVVFQPLSGTVSSGHSGRLDLGTQGGVVFDGVENFDVRLARDSTENVVKTGGGNDFVSMRSGKATADMGTGTDRLTVDWSSAGHAVVGTALTGSASLGYSGAIETPFSSGYGSKVTFSGVESFDIKLGFGDDELVNGGNADSFDGGEGIDLLRYAGNKADYTITTVGAVTTITRAGISDTIRNFEEIRFADSSLVLGDIHSANRSTRGELSVGGSVSGKIDYTSRYIGDLGDQDWLKINLTAGKTYEFSMKTTSGSAVDPHISGLYQLGGALTGTIDDNGGGGLNSKVTFTAATSGVYYLALTGGGTTTGTYTVTATEAGANSAPVITALGGGATAAITALETIKAVATITSTDPDIGATRSFSLSGADAALFMIDVNGQLSFKSAPDFEVKADTGKDGVYDVTVTVTDNGGLFDSQAIAVTVGNVNEAPLIGSNGGAASVSLSLAENSISVASVKASDQDAGAKIVYSIAGGADAARFAIDAKTGALTFKAAPDFELPADLGKNNVYDVVVRASDGTLSDTQAFAIKITDVKGTTKTGGAAAETFNGTAEADIFDGRAGNDTIKASLGADRITGGAGRDLLYGGVDTVKDTFVFLKGDSGKTTGSIDQIYDFRTGIDKIDLSGIDGDPASGMQDLRFVTAFSAPTKAQADGQFKIVDEGANARVEIDYNGDKVVDAIIRLYGVDLLAKGDFLL